MEILLMQVVATIGLAGAYGMSVDSGASDYQVFQRGPAGTAAIHVAGRSDDKGAVVQARIVRQGGGGAIDGIAWTRIGVVGDDGQWRGAVKGVPTGGPYRLRIRAVEKDARRPKAEVLATCPDVQHLLVGDLWVAAGQSNMIGRGALGPDREKPSQYVNIFDTDYRWRASGEPTHGKNVDPIPKQHLADQGSHSCVLKFARDLHAATKVPVGILPCAIGGSPMQLWTRPRPPDDRASLYGRTVHRVGLAGGAVTGVIWWQGESNAADSLAAFNRRFHKIIADLRKDLADPKLPFLFVQLESAGTDTITDRQWMNVREAQRLTEIQVPGAAMVCAIDLPRQDEFHVTTPGLKVVGSRLALAARALVHRQQTSWTGPRFKSARFLDAARFQVIVRFEGAIEEVRPATGITGFEVVAGGKPIAIKAVSRSSKACKAVVITLAATAPPGAAVRYGYGRMPPINLTDETGLPAPVFASQPIQERNAKAAPK